MTPNAFYGLATAEHLGAAARGRRWRVGDGRNAVAKAAG